MNFATPNAAQNLCCYRNGPNAKHSAELPASLRQCFTAPPLQGGQGGSLPPWIFGDESLPPGFPPWAQPGSAEGGASKTTQQAVSRSQIVQKQRGNACRDTKIPQNFPAAPSGAANGLNPLILIFRSPLRSTIPPWIFRDESLPPWIPPLAQTLRKNTDSVRDFTFGIQ